MALATGTEGVVRGDKKKKAELCGGRLGGCCCVFGRRRLPATLSVGRFGETFRGFRRPAAASPSSAFAHDGPMLPTVRLRNRQFLCFIPFCLALSFAYYNTAAFHFISFHLINQHVPFNVNYTQKLRSDGGIT